MQGDSGPKGDPGSFGIKGAKVWHLEKKNQKKIHGNVNISHFAACWFREILAVMGNQEDLESMAHRDLRWGDRKAERCLSDVHPNQGPDVWTSVLSVTGWTRTSRKQRRQGRAWRRREYGWSPQRREQRNLNASFNPVLSAPPSRVQWGKMDAAARE